MTRTRWRSGGDVSVAPDWIVGDARTIYPHCFLSGAGTGGSLCREEVVRVVSDDGTPAIPHDWNLAGRPTVLHLRHPGTLVLSITDPTEICNQAGTGRP